MVLSTKIGKLIVGSCALGGVYIYSKNKDGFEGFGAFGIPKAHSAQVFVDVTKPQSDTNGLPTSPPTKWDRDWDRRDPQSLIKPNCENPEEDLKNKKAKYTRNIILIRHGQYEVDGQQDAHRFLTKLGREQAALTGARLKSLGIDYDRVVYSTLTRATETANIIRESLNATIPSIADSMLEEGAPCRPEPSSANWRPDAKEFLVDGSRIEAAFRRHIHRAKPSQQKDTFEVYVCHANVIRYIVCRALQFPPEGWLRMSLAHGSITWLVVRPSGNVSLKCLGDSGFMPPDKVTYS